MTRAHAALDPVPPAPSPSPPGATRRPRRELLVLLLVLTAALGANAGGLTLPPLDDCFYARKGVEMARCGGSFTVTWNGLPAFQNPPLQFWILGLSFRLLGENDFAARLPTLLMALGILLGVWRLGAVALGGRVAATAVALLAASPFFLNNARRCMMEIPLAFWTTLALVVLVEGLRRPRLHILLAVPLAAAVLTKSVLGLLPVAIWAVGALFSPALRAPLRRPWLPLGVGLGLALGASWSVHQWLAIGPEALRAHWLGEVLERSARPIGLLRRVLGYPLVALQNFQPVILPAVAGAVPLWRARRTDHGAIPTLLVVWALAPFALYALSSAQSPRYVFPLFPALALCAAFWAETTFPRVAAALTRWVVPAALAIGALLLWVAPGTLTRQAQREFRDQASRIQSRIARTEPLTYLGDHYWTCANPLLYYAERYLEPSSPSADTALARARSRPSRLLLCDRRRLPELRARAGAATEVLTARDWVLLDVRTGGR